MWRSLQLPGPAVGVAVPLSKGNKATPTPVPSTSSSTSSRRAVAMVATLAAVATGRRARAQETGELDLSSGALKERLQNAKLKCPSWGISSSPSFPGWLFGEWEVCSRPVAYGEPLGSRFVDENTKAAIREDFTNEQTSSTPSQSAELRWKARYYWDYLDQASEIPDLPSGFLLAMPVLAAEVQGSQGGVVQFRAFNAGEELKAFLKQPVPRVIADADPHVQPLQINVSFPIEEEEEEFIRTVSLKLEASKTQYNGQEFVSSELFRQVVSTEGEIDSVGDFEVLNAYTLQSPGHVTVQNRVVKYLVPGDPLFEEAGNQAVSWLDYAWDLRRTKTCIGTPYGEQCAAPAAVQTVSPL